MPDDLVKNIRSYYGTTKLTSIVLENYLMLILTVPLIDTSLEMQTGTCLVWFVMLFSTILCTADEAEMLMTVLDLFAAGDCVAVPVKKCCC